MNNKDLTLEELEYVQKEVQINTKNVFVAYLLAVFLGSLGLHRAYFGKRNTAIIKAVLSIIIVIVVGYVFVSTGIATIQADQLTGAILAQYATLATIILFLGGISSIWSLIDLFLIPKWKRVHDELNRKKAHEEMIVARHTYEQLLRERVSEAVLEKVQKEVLDKMQEKMDKAIFEANLESAKLPQLSEVELVQDEVEPAQDEVKLVQDEIEPAQDEVELVQDEVEPAQDEVEPAQDEVEPAQDEVELVQEEVESVQDEVELVQDEVESVQDEVESVQDEVELVQDEVESVQDEVDIGISETEENIDKIDSAEDKLEK